GGKFVASVLKERKSNIQEAKQQKDENSNRNNKDSNNNNDEDPNGKKPEPSPDPDDEAREYLKKKVEEKVKEEVKKKLDEKSDNNRLLSENKKQEFIDLAERLKDNDYKEIRGECKGKRTYDNSNKKLPESGNYVKFDAEPRQKDPTGKKVRSLGRIVIDKNTGSIYYTPDHYKTFIQIR
ncbi:ribonuclease domain-containing protein, partial [uncultured Brachyspira sp.]|uniref:ribonuclease domain-containing protein n=1 Tax=uncultured Brachyspira sp. TaxID=221953 RepID=UPI00260F81ED